MAIHRDQQSRVRASARLTPTPVLLTALIVTVLIGARIPLTAQISYPSFASTVDMQLVGAAASAPPVLRLTGVGRMQSGAAWHVRKVRVVDGFVTTFEFQMNQTGGRQDNTNTNGGDGIAFVIQNSSEFARGGPGGQIGYGGIPSSVAIEFDTYLNDDVQILDPSANHISLQSGPNATANHATTVAVSSRIPSLDDGGVHTVVIEYVDRRMRVYIDNCETPAIDTPFDLARAMPLDNGTAWVGFTAATGDSWENHDIHSWRLNSIGSTFNRITLCDGDTLTLTAPGHFGRYEWSTGETTRSIRVTRAGTYRITAFDTLGCNTRTTGAEWQIDAATFQRPMIAPADTIWACEGQRVALDAGFSPTRRWSNGDTARTIGVNARGLYWVDVVDENGCSGRSDSVWVLFHPLPRPLITALGPTEFCEGDSVMLVSTEHSRYRWSTGDTTRSITVRTSGQYSVEVFDSMGCRGATDATVVLVWQRPRPVVRFIGPSALCDGANTTLDAGAGYARHVWSTGDTSRRIDVGTAGTYKVTVTTAQGCTGESNSVVVRVSPLPTPVINVSRSMPSCPGDDIMLSSPTSYAHYRWSTGDTTATISVDSSGTYGLTVIDSNGCEASAAPVDIRIAVRSRATITASGPLDICSGESVMLSGPADMRSYAWSNGQTSRAIVVSTSGLYHLRVIDTNGCDAADTVRVRVHARPRPIVSDDTAICEGSSVTLAVRGAAAVMWSPLEGLSCYDCVGPVARPTRTTTYVVTATGAGGCTATDSVTISVDPAVSAAVAVADTGRIYPGQRARVPMYLEGDLAEAGVDAMLLRIDYDSEMMLLKSVQPTGPFKGWSVAMIDEVPGRFTARLSAPSSIGLTGDGHTLDLEFQTYLGALMESRIDVELTAVDRPCVNISARPGALRLDSLCGMSVRMIESFGATLALDQNAPNPFNPSTEIFFSVPLDGHVLLSVHRSDGTVAAVLVDETLRHGSHSTVWDASGLPSGLYVCRLITGTGSRSIQMLLLK